MRGIRLLARLNPNAGRVGKLAIVLNNHARAISYNLKYLREEPSADGAQVKNGMLDLPSEEGPQLKCSEEKPRCQQCVKANRECVASSGITFRHQQNPSMNAVDFGEGSLKSFYGYRETFGSGLKWVDIPQNLTFVHTNNPYEDDDIEEGVKDNVYQPQAQIQQLETQHDDNSTYAEFAKSLAMLANNATEYHEDAPSWETSQAAAPNYATQGLEALSAVASRDQYNYAPPPATMSHGEQAPSHQSPAMGPNSQQATPVMGPPHNNLDFILNRNSADLTPDEISIDPRLNSPTPTGAGPGQPPPQEDFSRQPSNHVRTLSYSSTFGGPRLQSKGSISQRSRRPSIDDPELSFLLRDFAERAGMWMDLFDLGLFFAMQVPVLAVRCPLLLYSCAACSAKSLARVDGRKPVMGGQITPSQRCKMEFWPRRVPDAEGWVRKAREYYDQAVSLLRQALARGVSKPSDSALFGDDTTEALPVPNDPSLPTTESDELIAATAILCVYEFLDASGPEWSRHLDGAKTLFDIAKDRMVPLTLPPSPISSPRSALHRLSTASSTTRPTIPRGLSQGRRAVFWNFARQDMLAAFINNTSTRLDTFDLAMWRNAGLKLDMEGFVCPSNPHHPDYTPDTAMPNDLIANALVWLQQKLVNFIAAGDGVPGGVCPLGLGVRQQELLEYWESLDQHLRIWYEGLPDNFAATAVRPATHDATRKLTAIEQKWFPRPLCASTMQSYHFARIQLLHNKPHVSTAAPFASRPPSRPNPISPAPTPGTPAGSSLAARHASYASILQQSRTHAKEIVAIGLGRTDEGARIHSVQPLWTAGLVLGSEVKVEEGGEVDAETEMWRKCILAQLRAIEHDTGWASEYRVQNLLELWGLPQDWGVETQAVG